MELHLVLNENTDATTDRIWKEETVTIIKAKVNGKKVSKKHIIDGSYPGLRIGDLESVDHLLKLRLNMCTRLLIRCLSIQASVWSFKKPRHPELSRNIHYEYCLLARERC